MNKQFCTFCNEPKMLLSRIILDNNEKATENVSILWVSISFSDQNFITSGQSLKFGVESRFQLTSQYYLKQFEIGVVNTVKARKKLPALLGYQMKAFRLRYKSAERFFSEIYRKTVMTIFYIRVFIREILIVRCFYLLANCYVD